MGLKAVIKDAVCWDTPAVNLHTSICEVIELMVKHDTSALIVKADDGVAGVVSDLDVLESITSQGDLDETKVSDFLSACELISGQSITSPCVQLDENESVENAIKLLSTSGTHNLVVTGADKDAYGTVSSRDLLKLLIS